MDYSRENLLNLNDRELLKYCRFESFRAPGPGGQHRNTRDSAVRLVLEGTKISASSADSRSQHRNKRQALKKLRFRIGLHIRADSSPSWDQSWSIGKNDLRYPFFIGILVDALEIKKYRVSEAAEHFGISTGKFVRFLVKDPTLWKFVNDNRVKHGIPSLKA